MIKNITLSAEERLIVLAREKASLEKKTLNALFREWLMQYAANTVKAKNYRHLMKKYEYVKVGGKFSRDEFNER